jgi:DNA-directed RNA polymerase subunit RPC12/RpoP
MVPNKSRQTEFEQYTFNDGSPPVTEAEPEIAFECAVCHTRLTAPRDQVGQRIACPDCRTLATVPAKATPQRRKQLAPVDDYALCEDYDPASPPAPQPEYVAVYCGRCGTLMQIPPNQLGTEVTCPDCQKATVPQPQQVHRRREASAATGSYKVHEEIGQPPPQSVAYQEHVGFVCRCGTRLQAPVTEAGKHQVCPDCGQTVTVPSPRPKRPKPNPVKEVKGQYKTQPTEVDQEEASAPYRTPIWFSTRFKQMLDEKGRMLPEPPPPRWPLVSGVFTFPWSRGAVGKWLFLSFGPILAASIVPFGFFFLLAICLTIIWMGILFVNLLAILGDTAAGSDNIENWPNAAAFIDWFSNVFFIFNSLFVSSVAAGGVRWLLDQVQLPGRWVSLGVPLLLFPFLLLSMLEVNSPWVPFSKPVWRSLADHRRAWIGFYLESILLVAVTGGLVGAIWIADNIIIAIPLLSLTLVAMLMIYFRLLGRLAWCCSH